MHSPNSYNEARHRCHNLVERLQVNATNFVVRIVAPGDSQIADAIQSMAKHGGYVTAFSSARTATLKGPTEHFDNVEPIEFGRLLGLSARCLGLETGQLVNASQLVGAIAVACESMEENSPFFAIRKFRGFHRELSKVVEEFWRLGWDESDYLAAADSAESPLKEKLLEIANVDRKIIDFMAQFRFARSIDLARRLLEEGSQSSGRLPFDQLVVVASGERRPIWSKALRLLAAKGVRVQVFLESDSFEQFPDAMGMAADLGVDFGLPVSKRWWEGILDGKCGSSDRPQIDVLDVADPLAESEWIIRECAALRSEGIPLSKVTIFARNLKQYAPLLQFAATRFGVPIDLRRNAPLDSNGFVQFALSLLEAACSEDIRVLGRVAQSSYLALAQDQRLEVVKICTAAMREGPNSWDSIRKWQCSRADHKWLTTFLDFREANQAASRSFSAWRALLIRLLERVGPPRNEISPLQEQDYRAQKAMERALNDAALPYDSSNQAALKLDEFLSKCRGIFAEETYVTPGIHEGVRVVSNPDSIGDSEVVFCMGVLEGVFPQRRSENPILDDEERRHLNHLQRGLVGLDDSFLIARREREIFLRVCASAKNRLIFSYPRTDDERTATPAYYLSQMLSVMKDDCTAIHIPLRTLAPQDIEDCMHNADYELRTALDLPRTERVRAPQVVSEGIRERLRAQAFDKSSPRDVSRAMLCGFWSGASGLLKLRPKGSEIFWPDLRQLPVIAQLAKLDSPEVARKALDIALQSVLDDVFPYTSPGQLRLIEETAVRLIHGWVEREFGSRAEWRMQRSDTQLNVSLCDAGFMLHEIRTSYEKPLQLDATIAATYLASGVRTLLFYRSSQPELRFSNISNEDGTLELRIFAVLLSAKNRSFAIEVDATAGTRNITYQTPPQARIPTKPNYKSFRFCPDDEQSDPMREFKEFGKEIRRAADRMGQGSLLAVPGSHCNRCQFGELCRVHSNWGDRVELQIAENEAEEEE